MQHGLPAVSSGQKGNHARAKVCHASAIMRLPGGAYADAASTHTTAAVCAVIGVSPLPAAQSTSKGWTPRDACHLQGAAVRLPAKQALFAESAIVVVGVHAPTSTRGGCNWRQEEAGAGPKRTLPCVLSRAQYSKRGQSESRVVFGAEHRCFKRERDGVEFIAPALSSRLDEIGWFGQEKTGRDRYQTGVRPPLPPPADRCEAVLGSVVMPVHSPPHTCSTHLPPIQPYAHAQRMLVRAWPGCWLRAGPCRTRGFMGG